MNPSNAEFPQKNPFQRFPAAAAFATATGSRDYATHLQALNDYFRVDPYCKWFRPSYGAILDGLGAGYGDGRPNAALHTDFCSPLATCPTWSGLKREQRSALEPEGIRLWHRLIRALRPDAILMSVQRKYWGQVEFAAEGPEDTILRCDHAGLYGVRAKLLAVGPSKPSLLVYGRAAQLPFGFLNGSKKYQVGVGIKDRLGLLLRSGTD